MQIDARYDEEEPWLYCKVQACAEGTATYTRPLCLVLRFAPLLQPAPFTRLSKACKPSAPVGPAPLPPALHASERTSPASVDSLTRPYGK